jgi:hypothetical protein
MNRWNELLLNLRRTWDNFNERERQLLTTLGVVLAALVLIVPLYWIAYQNSELEDENEQLRSVLAQIAEHGDELQQFAAARKAAKQRYKNKTPPLGSFLETHASKHGLTIREVTDQPEKTVGSYHRRSAKAQIQESGLTGVVRVMGDVVQSPYPVAIDHVKIEHYQSGDQYRFSFGVLTFDKVRKAPGTAEDSEG